jgi:spore maturation protein CgeB
MYLDMKYVKYVDVSLPQGINRPAWPMIAKKFDVEFDLVLGVDAGFHLSTKPDAPYAIVLTDPHVLGNWYEDGNPYADWVFNMQRYYMKEGQIHLPYCASPDHHYPMNLPKEYDAALIGLHYEQRDRLVSTLRAKGYKVLYELGLVFDEYREQNNRATIGLNWSSLFDINARFFEAMAMKQVLVANRLPHIDELGLEENRHYLGFDTVGEATERVDWALKNPEFAQAIALNGYQHVMANHTYDLRVDQILRTTGLVQ